MEQVILVDTHDEQVGTMEKQEAHITGLLHRAVSVFVFNTQGQLLLQQRAAGKYHSALQWTNTCCSHPRPGEDAAAAAHRRLQEEMGFSCQLQKSFTFIYNASLSNGLIEHEYDHVFTGISNTIPIPDAAEVAQYTYMSLPDIKAAIDATPHQFTPWFRLCISDWEAQLLQNLTPSTDA